MLPDATAPSPCRLARPARLLAAADGPRIAALKLGGWDTRAGQAKRLAAPSPRLDAGLLALRDGPGTAWSDTAILVMTEFRRTALLAGSAATGGRLGGTWPSLALSQLFKGRDLAPTANLSGLAKRLLSAHLGLGAGRLQPVFPASRHVSPVSRLIRA